MAFTQIAGQCRDNKLIYLQKLGWRTLGFQGQQRVDSRGRPYQAGGMILACSPPVPIEFVCTHQSEAGEAIKSGVLVAFLWQKGAGSHLIELRSIKAGRPSCLEIGSFNRMKMFHA